MSHTTHGSIVGDKATGGVVDTTGCILLSDTTTLAMEPVALDPLGVRKDPAAIALALGGRINKTDDTVEAVFLLSVEDAGQLAGMLADACHRADGPRGLARFQDGLGRGLER